MSAQTHSEEPDDANDAAVSATPAAASRARSRRPQSSGRPNAVVRGRTYYREIVAELRKVIYPTRSELVTYTVVVLIFVSAMVAIVFGLDYGFTKLDLKVFG